MQRPPSTSSLPCYSILVPVIPYCVCIPSICPMLLHLVPATHSLSTLSTLFYGFHLQAVPHHPILCHVIPCHPLLIQATPCYPLLSSCKGRSLSSKSPDQRFGRSFGLWFWSFSGTPKKTVLGTTVLNTPTMELEKPRLEHATVVTNNKCPLLVLRVNQLALYI